MPAPCENAGSHDNDRVDGCHNCSEAIAALHFAGMPFNNFGTEEGYRCDALNVSREECSPIDDRPKAEDDSYQHSVGKAGLAQSCGDDMQTTQYEHGWREQGHPNWPGGIKTLGMGVHEITASHPNDQGNYSEGNQWAVHEMPNLVLPLPVCI